MYSPFTRIHWLQLVASVAGWVGGGSRYILSQAHLILAPARPDFPARFVLKCWNCVVVKVA